MSLDLTNGDVERIRDMLARAESALSSNVFTVDEVKSLRRIIETFDRYGTEIDAVITEKQVSKLWAQSRLQLWSIIKWFLAAFLMIVTAIQGWTSIMPTIKWWDR